jgi:ATP-dependent Lon protease
MSEKVTIKAERRELHLPAIALRGLVVFPNNLVHFEVGREKSIAAVEWAMANNSNVFLVAQKEMELSDPTQEDLFAYGVVAEVKQVLRVSDDLVKVLVEGKYRAKLTDLDTIAQVGVQQGYITQGDVARLLAFRDDPSDENWIRKGE